MFDVDWSDPETLWLNITNAALGIVTLAALLSVLGAAAVELCGRLKKHLARARDFRTLRVPDLGLTMADGGEKIDEKDAPPPKPKVEGRRSKVE
ncbi:MAG: hypothetical protein A3F84_27835 [Candidatus Handelsmanbacteria bacterium RIFCSPLOWO2_12_FULL_64_10]|uniref:Uncharacterized protein n=1 Tax=Handelsmanbacteria sp. (strain RIFCSPLOWO2_12_FULL_64_10) TaxID=1817868 RepID=A0A1F6C4C8_HANXR|nr:MAG: hypothetical protein A3F84_27835 [Candidatus Handelsmanbacteria bacterium RIFCSPLOWO2_12_FULL_64_10]